MQKGHPTQHSHNNTNDDNIHNFNNNTNNNNYNNNNDNNDNHNNNLTEKLIISYLKQKTIYNNKSNEVVACKNGSRNVF